MTLYFRWIRVLKYYLNIKVILGLVPLVVIVNTILYVLLFSKSNVIVIRMIDIPDSLVTVEKLSNSTMPYCEVARRERSLILQPPSQPVPEEILDLLATDTRIQKGGAWKPENCISPHKVALIIPYRDRKENLRDFLAYMHPFLQKQNLDYRIVVVEQTDRPFNRAKLFNIGFVETEKIDNFHCYIFHDVDLLPQNLNNIYGCTNYPRHMSANINIFDYKVPYDSIFGGSVAILKSQFQAVNGFSNIFFGWGGEDDDFYNRVTRNGSKICRFSSDVSQYVMLSHKKEKPSSDRYYVLVTGKYRFLTDGLNSLKYSVIKIDMLPLYTRILVDI
ncbi:beta-1,4-galactosyltransferase 1-like [Cimex lectularius]|uniref:Beta-1,4-N-acetylgalactosaminyltransferase n=1 Tax=Cimex lectularius TaxID=79782 RepID=A0A8I6SVJ3_CIMLE|nr:beta-1,4-galactosyltransferase 1-like [Cimex lectularius]